MSQHITPIPNHDSSICLARLHARIRKMILEILANDALLTKYHTGQLVLNFSGLNVKAQIDKLSLTDNKLDT